MKKSSKVIVIVLAVVLVLFLAVTFGGGAYMVNFALLPENRGFDIQAEREKMESRCPGIIAWQDELIQSGCLKDTFVVFPNGRRMHAQYAAAAVPGNKTAILLHGYGNNPTTMVVYARMFRDSLGFNVFMPGMAAHGQSEGTHIQMGWKDREDALQWIPVAHDIFKDDEMIIFGMSMGAATTMMLSGEETPDYVKAFIEDAGYTSVWDQFKDQLDKMFGLPPFPVLYGADLVCRMRFGWNFKEASSVKQVAKSTKPMLFIHGEQDDFVPTWMLMPCYEAKTQGYKEYWIAPGSAHVRSITDHQAEFTAHVRAFLDKI